MFRAMKHFFLSPPNGGVLLEALLAVVILSVGLTAVIRSFSLGIRAHAQSRDYFIAASLLENKLAELLAGRYFDEASAGEGEYGAPFSGYRYEVAGEPLGEDRVLRKVTVTIIWGEKERLRSVDAVTYLFARPEEDRG